MAILFVAIGQEAVDVTRRCSLIPVHWSDHDVTVVTEAIWLTQLRLVDEAGAARLVLIFGLQDIFDALSKMPVQQLQFR
jgi:hypothetical protein